jgi:transposase
VHAVVDTLGNLLTVHVTPASDQDRQQVRQLAKAVQQVTGDTVKLIFADQGYTGDEAQQAAKAHGITLQVVKHTEAKRGFVLLPRRWVVGFRRLARDYERLATTIAGYHYLAFDCLMLHRLMPLVNSS